MSGWIDVVEDLAEKQETDSGARAKKATRPPGLRGSHGYRNALRRQESQELENSTPPDLHSKMQRVRSFLANSRKKATDEARSSMVLQKFKDAGSTLQISLGQWASTQASPPQKASAADTYLKELLYEPERPVCSRHAESKRAQKTSNSILRKAKQCAGMILNASGYLWGCTFCQLAEQIASHVVKPLLLVKKRRYDETPSNIRLTSDTPSEGEKNRTAKIFQSEFQIAALLQHVESGEFLHFQGHIPTWLAAVDHTTADVTKYVQDQLEGVLPETDRLAQQFVMSVHLVNTDAYAANLRAEEAIAREHPSFSLSHYFCDHHSCWTCLGKGFKLVPEAISGMISGALSMQAAGETTTVRQCLMTVIEDRLQIHVGAPPGGRVAQYREAVYDLFLKLPHGQHSKKRKHIHFIQRLVLSTFLNGDLQDTRNVHMWTLAFWPNREHILAMFKKYVVPCLLPCKAPLFPRSRWTNTELAIDYFGLLTSHHNLLLPTVQLWIKTNVKPQELVSTGGWADVLADPGDSGLPPLEDEGEAEDEPHPAKVDDDQSQKNRWIQMRKQNRKKFRWWVEMQPGPTLVIMRVASSPVVNLTHALLHRAGVDWERKEQQHLVNGEPRSYRVLEAFRGTDLKTFFAEINHLFHRAVLELADGDMLRRHQVLLFRMLSSYRTSIASYIGLRWRAFPVRLFGLLDGVDCFDDSTKPCMLDGLSSSFLSTYCTPEARTSPAAISTLEVLANNFSLGIAEVEARHAATRRVVSIKSVQTHVPALEDINCQWICRRNATLRTEHHVPRFIEEEQEKEKPKKKAKYQNPGGPWKAFLNENAKGMKLTPERIKDLQQQYHGLTDEQRNYYRSVGQVARVAGLAGHRPFGEKPQRELANREPSDVLGNASFAGAVIETEQMTEFSSKLVALRRALKETSRSRSQADRNLNDELATYNPDQTQHDLALRVSSAALPILRAVPLAASASSAYLHQPADAFAEATRLQVRLKQNRLVTFCCGVSVHYTKCSFNTSTLVT